MCNLLTDVQIEANSVAADPDDYVPVTCETGRVILAASAFIGSGTGSGFNKWPVAVVMSDGVLTDTVYIETAGAGVGHGSTLFYYLTTAKESTL